MAGIVHVARTSDGVAVHPGEVVIPILVERSPRLFSVVGTGFFITRYGLFLTAKHVLEEIVDANTGTVNSAFVLQRIGEDLYRLRSIRKVWWLGGADVGAGQADNRNAEEPGRPLMNRLSRLTRMIPAPGQVVTTYAYPGNVTLDLTDIAANHAIGANYFAGRMLAFIERSDNPFIPYPHLETSIEILAGASGCPVYHRGQVVGLSCRGWDFRGAEHEGEHLSSIIPVGVVLPLEVDIGHVPPMSWEYGQIPRGMIDRMVNLEELAACGHLMLE